MWTITDPQDGSSCFLYHTETGERAELTVLLDHLADEFDMAHEAAWELAQEATPEELDAHAEAAVQGYV